MVFLVKQPPELLRVLCASHCPPHNVLHYMSDFPLYYNPLYYLTCFLSILIVQWKFVNGCWLDRKLNSFLLLQPSLEPFVDDAHYFASIFEIRFCCLIIHILISYIKSVLFSFCRLHEVLLERSIKICSTFCSVDVDCYKPFIDAIVTNIPSWTFQGGEDDCTDCLMSLSMTQLQPVLRLLQILNCRQKCVSMML